MAADWAALTVYDSATAFWVTVVGVVLLGFGKGGLGGAFALVGVPVLALVMPPMQAAALLVPLLLMMDAIGLWVWRGWVDRGVLHALLPGALGGIVLGALTAALLPEPLVGLIVGVIAVLFTLREALGALRRRTPRRFPRLAWLFGAGSGFTSFVAHAGGPLFQVHVLPLRLDPRLYAGTAVVYFAVVNAVKVIPYAALGLFDLRIILSALVMMPAGVLGVWLGAAVVRRMPARVFYPFSYAMVSIVSLKLIWDGLF